MFEAYKANRTKSHGEEDGFIEQFEALQQFLDLAGFRWHRERGVEADDHIAKMSKTWDGSIVVVSSDHDLQQLVNERVLIYLPGRPQHANTLPILDEQSIIEKHGLPPTRLPELYALTGDASDGIPGVKGIGPKKALKLLLDGPLDRVLAEHPELEVGGSQQAVINNYFLMELTGQHSDLSLTRDDCPVPVLTEDRERELMQFFETWEFDTLARQLQEGMLW